MAAPPLLYRQVRMLAEAALGVPNGESAVFWFQPDNADGPVLQQPGATPSPDSVLVPAYNLTTVGPLSGVTMRVGTEPGINVLTDLGAGVRADAAFWSDASVQKFVFPYYASCMGYDASRRLDRLQRVWNGSFTDRQVYALLHVTGSVPVQNGGTPQPVEPIWVVYFDEPSGSSRAVPLASFPDPLPELPEQPLPQAEAYVQPDPAVLQGAAPTYGALRSLAEWSASMDTSFTYFAYDPRTNTFGNTQAGPGNGDAIVVPVYNPNVPANRPTDIAVELSLPDGTRGSVYDMMSYQKDGAANYPDAFCWSTGSIEQFLLPYYASVDGFGGLPDLLSIQNAWTQNYQGTGGWFTGGASGSLLGPQTGQVLGLVHIPRSIWVTDEGTAALGETGFVHTTADGVSTTGARQFISRSLRAR